MSLVYYTAYACCILISVGMVLILIDTIFGSDENWRIYE